MTIEFLDDHSQTTYQIVGKQEANLAEQKLAFDSPLGKALSNKKLVQLSPFWRQVESIKLKLLKLAYE